MAKVVKTVKGKAPLPLGADIFSYTEKLSVSPNGGTMRHQMPVSTEDEATESPNGAPFTNLLRYERQVPVRQISFYFCGEIQEPQYYAELFYTLRTANETDLIYLHLNSPGGDFDTGMQIINNMVASEAQVITVLESYIKKA